jgi:hypothetical protein
MSFSFTRDDARRRIVATGEGRFCADDILGILEWMRREGTWSYGLLCEMRRMSGSPSATDLRRILEGAAQPGPHGEHAGPTAVVIADPVLYGTACAYAAMGPPGKFAVFTDRIDAEPWLVSHTLR